MASPQQVVLQPPAQHLAAREFRSTVSTFQAAVLPAGTRPGGSEKGSQWHFVRD